MTGLGRNRWRRSLFKRLLWIQLGLVSVVWVAYCLLTWSQLSAQESGLIDSDLRLIAGSLAAMTSVHESVAEQRVVVERIANINLEASNPPMARTDASYQLWSRDGRLLVRWPTGTDMPDAPPPGASAPSTIDVPGWVARGHYSDDGRVYAVVGYSRKIVEALERMVIWQSVIGAFVLGLIVSLMLWLTARVGLRPLGKLAATLGTRHENDFSPMDSAVIHAELKPLVAMIDARNRAVQSMMSREREFFADAAHELRTPLAALGAQAHVLAGATSDQERQAALLAMEGGVQRCASSLDKLLLLARIDAQVSEAGQMSSIDLAALARDAIERLLPRAIATQVSLGYEGETSLPAFGDAHLLATALDCLLDNALRHGGKAVTTATVAAGVDSNGWWLDVSDDGPGIAEADRERVFERFVRGATQAEGSGLGLAIVRRIANLHGGTAAVLASSRGCRIRVSGVAKAHRSTGASTARSPTA